MMALSQARDPEILAARTAITSLVLQDIQMVNIVLLCDVSSGVPRPLVPSQHRREVFNAIHGLAHLGPVPTTRAVSDRFDAEDQEILEPGREGFRSGRKAQRVFIDRDQVEIRPCQPAPRETGKLNNF